MKILFDDVKENDIIHQIWSDGSWNTYFIKHKGYLNILVHTLIIGGSSGTIRFYMGDEISQHTWDTVIGSEPNLYKNERDRQMQVIRYLFGEKNW